MADPIPSTIRSHFPRQSSSSSAGDKLLDLLGQSAFQTNTIVFSLATAIPLTLLIAILFSFLRPHNSVVYAPRARHADSKHAPPPISKGLFAWIPPLITVKEQDLVEKVGLDAAVFLRVCRMLRNIFVVLTLLGCGVIIPTGLIATSKDSNSKFFDRITPRGILSAHYLWPYVLVSYLFTLTVCFFLWINYRAIFRLRRAYFDSQEYKNSLHARTLLITDIPKELRSDEGIVRLTNELRATATNPRAAVARNVRDLPDLVDEHEETVRDLEKVLAKYFKNPDHLPLNRPLCKPSKRDKTHRSGDKVDAIEYLTARIRELEIEIKQVRESVDRRNALSYGFASYEDITDAHTAAFVARKGGPHGSLIRLAPRPNDLVWKNLSILKKERGWQNFINNLWITLLTIVWIGPNVMMSVFLSNLGNLGILWPGFQKQLIKNPKFWAFVQAVAAPAITTLLYFYLPSIFRKLCVKAGDITKTSRERHVMHKLYSFFVLNQFVVFSLFAAVFGYAVQLVRNSNDEGFEKALFDEGNNGFVICFTALINIAPYWVSWLLQRNLGAAIDLSQLYSLLVDSFSRKYRSPTPRERIELTAPQPFDYASYYNYFLFYSTVAICFAPIQPLVLPVVALYFTMDCFLKKYLLLYIFITKYESGGMFWRSIFNRALFMLLLSYLVLVLLLVAKLMELKSLQAYWGVLVAVAPLILIVLLFKWYCVKTFDKPIHYYSTGKALLDNEFSADSEHKRRRGERIGVRFGHPVLYKKLITPMVSAKAQHLLKEIYHGRLDDEVNTTAGFSDVYMGAMDSKNPGKSTSTAPFEFVHENDMNFEHFKNRPEFRDQAGGDGQLFGRNQDIVRPGTPGSMSMLTRTATAESLDSHANSDFDPRQGYHSRDMSGDSDKTRVGEGMDYPHGYHQMPSNMRDHSPMGSEGSYEGGPARYGNNNLVDARSRETLVGGAARMGYSNASHVNPYAPAPGGYAQLGGTPLGGTPRGTPGEEETSYDYFRRGRQRQ